MSAFVLLFALVTGTPQKEAVSVLSQNCVDLWNAELPLLMELRKDPTNMVLLIQAQLTEQARAACQKALFPSVECPKLPCGSTVSSK